MPHPNKVVRDALQYASDNDWRIVQGGSHAWGQMYCPYNDKTCRCGEFCRASIWSTPKNPENHAKQIRRIVDNCVLQKTQNLSAEE
ncbi:hypothetical protein [Crenothrix polyspora]|uniref:hypothetical protein n=1 Tax=Crenothrix polyspora TaxID=360316 RepID=UPI000B36012D|nr:hypothetical protein [Crenothrix polyspora]